MRGVAQNVRARVALAPRAASRAVVWLASAGSHDCFLGNGERGAELNAHVNAAWDAARAES